MDAAWRSFGSSSGRVRRFEWEFLFLIGLVAFVYGSRPTDLHLRGEETRRAEVAVEMLQTGDWIVPRQQGEIYISRPPLANWCIAAAGYLRGGVDTVAARLPSIVAVLITTLMIYGLGRAEVGRFGAFTAAVAFATMVQVMQIGRTAETEAVFTAILSASLFVWFHGYRRGWSPWTLWGVGYTLAGLAALAKGPQGPPYFIGPAVLFLLYKRDWKTLFAPGHFAGVAVMLTVIGAWQIPYIVSAGPENALGVWMKLAKNNFGDENEASLTLHMLSYPFEVLACMLPWSLGLIPLLSSKLRSSLGSRRDVVMFHALAMFVTFPTVWLAVHAVPRYFMPLYPSAALVIGVVADRLLTTKPAGWVAA
ncbi:MAG: glycosyltransferase family 39 protein, partial [Planctomycetota bacterium]